MLHKLIASTFAAGSAILVTTSFNPPEPFTRPVLLGIAVFAGLMSFITAIIE